MLEDTLTLAASQMIAPLEGVTVWTPYPNSLPMDTEMKVGNPLTLWVEDYVISGHAIRELATNNIVLNDITLDDGEVVPLAVLKYCLENPEMLSQDVTLAELMDYISCHH